MRFSGPTQEIAEAHTAAGGESYVYKWSWSAPTGRYGGMAIHGLEMSFVFDNIPALAARYYVPRPDMQPRANTAHALWSSFIKNGNPTAPGVPAWPPFTAASRKYLLIGDKFVIA